MSFLSIFWQRAGLVLIVTLQKTSIQTSHLIFVSSLKSHLSELKWKNPARLINCCISSQISVSQHEIMKPSDRSSAVEPASSAQVARSMVETFFNSFVVLCVVGVHERSGNDKIRARSVRTQVYSDTYCEATDS